jgi:hypothetical protein
MAAMTDRPEPDPAGGSAGPRPLERAPGERYRTAGGEARSAGSKEAASAPVATAPAPARPTRTIAAGSAVAVAGGAFYALLSQVDIGPGLLAVAAFIGWCVAVAMLWNASPGPFRRRGAVAAALGGGSIVLGLLLAWAWSRVEGGVLGPLEYVDQRFGPVAYLEIAVASGVAWLRAR